MVEVDIGEQGRGLGSALVRDALLQTAAIADRVGVRALLIHAETPEAAELYRGIDPGFEPSPTDPLHLVLLMKDLRAAIRCQSGKRWAQPTSEQACGERWLRLHLPNGRDALHSGRRG